MVKGHSVSVLRVIVFEVLTDVTLLLADPLLELHLFGLELRVGC